MKTGARARSVEGGVRSSRKRRVAMLRNPRPATLAASLVFMAALESGGVAFAQPMTDPTRPPAGFALGDPQGAIDASAPVLQSVMISPTGRAAIISGEMVRVGQKFGDAVLVKVAEGEVVLRTGSGTQVLKLYPGVDKRASAPAGSQGAPRRGKRPAAPAASRQGER